MPIYNVMKNGNKEMSSIEMLCLKIIKLFCKTVFNTINTTVQQIMMLGKLSHEAIVKGKLITLI